MLHELTSSPFNSLREWTDTAKTRTADNPPDPEPLLRNLPRRCIRDARIADHLDKKGRILIAFDIDGPRKKDGIKTREVLPVHFALIRALEQVPGVTIGMHRNRASTDTGFPRFYVHVRIDRRQRQNKTNLARILFGISGEQLYERKCEDGGDHRRIIPATYQLRPSLTRQDVLDHTRKSGRDDLAGLLSDLFDIADGWHGAELPR